MTSAARTDWYRLSTADACREPIVDPERGRDETELAERLIIKGRARREPGIVEITRS